MLVVFETLSPLERAALRPVVGAGKLARLFAHVGPRYAGLRVSWTVQGGVPTAVLGDEHGVRAAVSVETDPSGRWVTAIYGNLDPAKLAHLACPAT